MQPLVSVIIPTFNESANIKNCLKSINEQDYKNVEIIVVDNFSKDNTAQIVSNITKRFYLKGNERSAQRNFGAKTAKGKLLLFLDADMQLTKNVINEAVNKIKMGKFIIAFPEQSIGTTYWEKSIALERNLYQNEQLLSGARLFTKDVFLKLKGYDKKLVAGEDWDLTIRAKKLGCKLFITKTHIIHNENVKNLKKFINKKAYYARNIGLYASKHPRKFAMQSSLKNRLKIYIGEIPKLISDPLHTFGFIFLKLLVWYDWKTKN